MAFVVPTRNGRFEIRESRSTPDGPRSRTLVSFAELDDEAISKALERAAKKLDPNDLRGAALRAGAPIAPREIDRAARSTLRLLARGDRPDPILRTLLLEALGGEERGGAAAPPSAAALAAAEWAGVGAEERGEALRDLLELADALPVRVRTGEIDFPRLRST